MSTLLPPPHASTKPPIGYDFVSKASSFLRRLRKREREREREKSRRCEFVSDAKGDMIQ
jgi:hypothetical protein